MSTPLWKHQEKGISLATRLDDFAFFFEMGTGKTRTTVETLRRRYAEQSRLMRTLILCPVAVLDNWKAEIVKFSKISGKEILVLDRAGKRRAQDLYKATFDGVSLTKGKIVITNYEAMQMKDFVDALMDWHPEILVCDESHRCKNHQSKRAKEVVKFADKAKHVYLLTGTPIINNPMDIFNQYRILDGGETFGQNFYAFRGRFFEDENAQWAGKPNYFPKFVPRPETFPEMNAKIYRKALRVLKSECLDLPPMVRQVREVCLGSDQKRMYMEMRDEYVTYIAGLVKSDEPKAVIAQLAITKALRLQQIVSGFAKSVDEQIHRIKSNPRLDELAELLEELTPENKVIVWATFKENYKMIAEVLRKQKIQYAELHGDISQGDRKEMLRKFREEESCRVMVANQGAAGIGINLVEAAYSIFYSRNFSLEQDLQAEARNYRGGSEIHSKITRIDLIAKGTIDELISEALLTKQDISQKILDWKV